MQYSRATFGLMLAALLGGHFVSSAQAQGPTAAVLQKQGNQVTMQVTVFVQETRTGVRQVSKEVGGQIVTEDVEITYVVNVPVTKQVALSGGTVYNLKGEPQDLSVLIGRLANGQPLGVVLVPNGGQKLAPAIQAIFNPNTLLFTPQEAQQRPPEPVPVPPGPPSAVPAPPQP